MPNPFPADTLTEIARHYCTSPNWPEHLVLESCVRVLAQRALFESLEVCREIHDDGARDRAVEPVRYDLWLITRPPLDGTPFHEAVRVAMAELGWPLATNVEIEDFCVLMAAEFKQLNRLP